MIQALYDISPFSEWFNPIPDDIGEDDLDVGIDSFGLRPDAPQSAKDAYEKYLKDMEYAKKHGIKF